MTKPIGDGMRSIRWDFEDKQTVTVTKGYNPPSMAEQAESVLRSDSQPKMPSRRRRKPQKRAGALR